MRTAIIIISFLILYFPFGVICVQSFNASSIVGTFHEFTFSWYTKAIKNTDLADSIILSLIISLSSSIISTTLGLLTSTFYINLKNEGYRGRMVKALFELPMITPD